MNPRLIQPDVEIFLRDHIHMDPSDLALKKSPFPELTAPELAEQLAGMRIARKKLPSWFRTEGLYYPGKRAMEQCSSEVTASDKALKASAIDGLWDLCGGAGVDTYFMGRIARSVQYIEREPELFRRTMHNLERLGAKGLRGSNAGAAEFLQKHKGETDWVYIDPDRRDRSGRRSFLWDDCSPALAVVLPLLEGRARHVLIKASPLLDLKRGAVEILSYTNSFSLRTIRIVAYRNEVKELLFELDRGPRTPYEETCIQAAELDPEQEMDFSFRPKEDLVAEAIPGPETIEDGYLYLPHPAISKAGAFQLISSSFGLAKLHPNTHLYYSLRKVDFPGKRLRIRRSYGVKSGELKEWKGRHAHVVARNFGSDAHTIRKKLGLLPGRDTYLIFTTLHSGKPAVLEAIQEK